MKKTIEINDTLDDTVAQAISELKELIISYYEENTEEDDLCLSNDLDCSVSFHEIVDNNVPIYDDEIRGLWYLYENEFSGAYRNAGAGDDVLENNGMAAIYCYIREECGNWWNDNHESIQEKVNDRRYESVNSIDRQFLESIEELQD